jgi:hypothetical protein
MDAKFGKEVQILIEFYSATHLRIKGKPNSNDAIDSDKFNTILYKAYVGKQQTTCSCLIADLMQKPLQIPPKKASVFLATNEELVQALRNK